jgi:hypothetical protein
MRSDKQNNYFGGILQQKPDVFTTVHYLIIHVIKGW